MVPGDVRHGYDHAAEARQILTDAEQELQGWQPTLEDVQTNAHSLGANLMPGETSTTTGAPSEIGTNEPQATPVDHVKNEEKEGTHLSEAVAA